MVTVKLPRVEPFTVRTVLFVLPEERERGDGDTDALIPDCVLDVKVMFPTKLLMLVTTIEDVVVPPGRVPI